jgi:hypothetical protein
MRSSILTLMLSVAAAGQPAQPQLVWEAEVDGTCVLHVRGNRIDIDDRQGRPVARERHRFFDVLPEMRQEVRVAVAQGRDSVRVLQQPSPSNNYTLSVLIEDRPGGAAFYSLAFHWQANSRTAFNDFFTREPRRRNLNPGEDRVVWSGRVDDEAVVQCSQSGCRTSAMRGRPVERERFTFTRPLPSREVRVSLDDSQGRGEILLVEQPSAANGYTATVAIADRPGGQGDYAFSLYWREPRASEPDRLFARPGARWSGRVDGRVRVRVQGTSGGAETLSGAPVADERLVFDRPMPAEAMPNIAVKRLRGRGSVEIVEFPSAGNGHQLTFEVNDSAGGADTYDVEIGW